MELNFAEDLRILSQKVRDIWFARGGSDNELLALSVELDDRAKQHDGRIAPLCRSCGGTTWNAGSECSNCTSEMFTR